MTDKMMVKYVVNKVPRIATDQTLKELKAKIDDYVEKHGIDAVYEIIVDNGWVDEYITSKRLETDREYQGRIEREQRIRQQTEEQERKEFERLKAKYGSQ